LSKERDEDRRNRVKDEEERRREGKRIKRE
jgi:hypothetical protein